MANKRRSQAKKSLKQFRNSIAPHAKPRPAPRVMTEAELLNMYVGNDNFGGEGLPIPDEVFAILKRKARECLRANNIPIPESLRED